ncbi:NACHT domain-containing protein [Phytohabitans sp. LJ34]|uniref:NACHT domain-containing protein n=1 Tax=Phytohabitans sp. LJ34 TaxID=3452217 RepID=UPI003F8A7E70
MDPAQRDAEFAEVRAFVDDDAVANALRRWAAGQDGWVRLPSFRWEARGYSGSRLIAIWLMLAGSEPNPHGQKLIAKVLPAGPYSGETGRHRRALTDPAARDFARRRLVQQYGTRQPVDDGRHIMFQDPAGSLDGATTLAKVSEEFRAEACGHLTRILIDEWNVPLWPNANAPFILATVADEYLRIELRDSLVKIRAVAEALWPGLDVGVARWIDMGTGLIPNPIRMAEPDSQLHDFRMEYLAGRAHGDLHLDNALVPVDPPEPPLFTAMKLIDLSAFSLDAPLTRDIATLTMSVAAKELERAPGDPATRESLRRFVLDPRADRPAALNIWVADALREIHRGCGSISDGVRLEWRHQRLLSLAAAALAYLTYDSVDPADKRWFFQVAGHAVREFLRLRDVPDVPPGEREPRVTPPAVEPKAPPVVGAAASPTDMPSRPAVGAALRYVDEVPVVIATGFRDRDVELKRLEDAVADTTKGLVAVVGGPGSGKTALIYRLRQQLARDKSPHAVDGFFYLSGAGYQDIGAGVLLDKLAALVEDPEAQARLRLRLKDPVPWVGKLDHVMSALSGQRVVVILDDADEQLDRDGDLRDRELRETLLGLLHAERPGFQFVVVARQRPEALLRALGNRAAEVPLGDGLPAPFAMDLLRSLGIADAPDDLLRAVHDLTGGVPRVLELFAAVCRKAPSGSVRDLVSELDRRLREDQQPPGEVLFERIYKGLSEVERGVVEALAVYERAVEPAAVAYLLRPYGPVPDSRAVLGDLHRRGVVRHDDGQYFLPPEPDQRLVLSTMPPGERVPALRLRAADYFAHTSIGRVTGVEDLRPRLAEVHLRIRAGDYDRALDLMTELDDEHLIPSGNSDVLIRWRTELKHLLTDPDDQAHNLSYLVAARQQQEDYALVVEELTTAMRLKGRLSGDRIVLRLQLASAWYDEGRISRALHLYRRTVRQCRLRRMGVEEVGARLSLGLCLAKIGEFPAALRQYTEAQRAIDRLPARESGPLRSLLCLDRALTHAQLGEWTEALAAAREGRSLANAAGEVLREGQCLDQEAAAFVDDCDPDRAVAPAVAAAEIGIQTRNPKLTRSAYLNLALAYAVLERTDDAAAAVNAASRLYAGPPRAVGALSLQGIVALRQGDPDRAYVAFSRAYVSASSRLRHDGRDYAVHEQHGLALCGLALTDNPGHAGAAVEAVRLAREISGGRARGSISRIRLMLRLLGDPEILAGVRRANEGLAA